MTELFPKYRIIKGVRVNLLMGWLQNNFPEVPKILIVRHPCAVVLSWLQLGWSAEKDISAFLGQADLIDDYLSDKLTYLQETRTNEEKIAAVWCVSNLIPLLQLTFGNICIVFYENLCNQPEVEIARIFSAIDQGYDESILKRMNKPATTSHPKSAVINGKNLIYAWRKKLSAEKTARVLSTVEAFGMNQLYGDSAIPLPDWHLN